MICTFIKEDIAWCNEKRRIKMAKNKKEKKMTNKEFLRRASKLQKEFVEIYKGTGLLVINEDCIQVSATQFHELERESLLEHVSKVKGMRNKGVWNYEAMTQGGVKVIAIEHVNEMEKK